ncbi:hypothetical protein LV84_03541 [Algoriphagus ratkowskyi]|uniref:Uncharacterized protein n=1 Tax=Algoriphagus ratkowskyi TaxID=57028 RepID=A0A2W7SN18_9BACT|nr:hypothetical protein [Algoriphagus ratkowskyi]PZX52132.1 hypothetical protein LV84_03541 [Algoriphagus ratkowskyi]TXD76106.1 hypothetical protein ESW18_17710 [Algoriphagus ratkowskyi]
MKLEKILDRLSSIEKNSFIKVIDTLISKSKDKSKEVEKILVPVNKGLKSVDSLNISKIFELMSDEFMEYVQCEFQEVNSQLDIFLDIIIRDGNCIMRQDWFSRLYESEIKNLKSKIKSLEGDFENEKSELSQDRKRDYRIYKACLSTAFFNDVANNREAKITSDELSIVLTLVKELGLSQEEVKLINYSILPVKKMEILDVINNLKNIGIIFYSKKENTLFIADEMVRLLRKVRKKEVADKFYRRTLKLLREPEINTIAKKHNIDRKLTHFKKIEGVINAGISFSDLLQFDLYKEGITLTEKKKALNELCEKGLQIPNLRGSTLQEKIESLIHYFEAVEKDEKVGISIDGYDKLLTELHQSLPALNKKLKEHFELQDEFVLEAEFLLDYNIKPRDILDLLEKSDIEKFKKDNGVKLRGDDILNILEHYKDVENIYLENYEHVGYRNYNQLKENGIQIRESELGVKFEELTKIIFQGLGFNVDEKFRQELNTQKDLMDILINLGNGEVIIVECKTSKESGYNKFSTVSRQLKSYQNVALKNNLRIVKILLVAPEFSDDFVTDCEMDVDMNLSLLTASTLRVIYETFKNSKYQMFPHVLFRDVVINQERIVKALSK